MKHRIFLLILAVFLVGISFGGVSPTVRGTTDCTVIDFEDVPDVALVGEYYISQGVRFETYDTYWRAVAWDVLDKRYHGDAVCLPIPSGNKVAHLSIGNSRGGPQCGFNADNQPGAFIFFDNPVQSVSFYYAACNNVFLEAFDASGTSLGIASGPPTDSHKPHCNFRRLEIMFDACIISKVEIRGVAMIDDLEFCCVPQPQNCCQDGRKPNTLTMKYTGQNCDATNNDQDPRKVSCSGDPNFASPVSILATDKSDPNDSHAKVWFDGVVNLNDTFVISAANAGENELKADTFVHIYGTVGNPPPLLQSLKFHTSCSQPLNTGDQFGSLLLLGCAANGGNGGPDMCTGKLKPQVLTMEYTADDCDATSHSQDPNKVKCSDLGALTDPAYILARDKKDDRKVWFQGTVFVGDMFDIDARNAGQNKLTTNTLVRIYAYQDGPLLQEVEFHTSCSQPLVAGDQFGSLILRDGVFVK